MMIFRGKKDHADAEAMLRQYQAWDDSKTAALQLQKLDLVWQDCVHDVPYYSNLVDAGDAPKRIVKWSDFFNLPELNRQILQDRACEFHRRSGPPDLIRMTGGSTGTPVRFGVWKAEDRTIRLLKLTLWIRAGYDWNDRLFLIWGHSHLLGTGWRRYLKHFERRFRDQCLGYRRVDAYVLNAEACRRYAQQMLRFKPSGLIGYAAALDLFVRSNIDLEHDFRFLNLKFVMPCAEPPPKPDTFALFRSTFNCPVIQEFGGVDFGQVASQYDDEPFNVFPDQNVVEVADYSAEKNESAVLITPLYRRYLPLIRYRQGDAISGIQLEQHGHVRSFDQLVGRTNDMILLNGGKELHSVALFHCIHQEQQILNIQMILEDTGLRLVLVTKDGRLDQAVAQRIRYRLCQLAPQLESTQIECRTDVETTRAGKRRWYVDKRTTSSL